MLTILLLIPRKRKEVKMLEITFEHKDIFELFKENEHVYKDGVYDFTFEGRFSIYHTHHRNELVYIALDMETGYGSEVTVKQNGVPYAEKEYPTLIPLILNSIKYTGDRRGSSITNSDPIELIDYIFKTVMPRYGYKLRNEQMVLSKAMYESISEKLVGICEAEVGCGKTLAYKMLWAVYDMAKDRLKKYELFVMTRGDNMSIKKFKESKNGVLFASGAMWEGVDCAGDCLSSVIITRLPFPIRNAITEQKKKESNNITEFISTYVVPEMIIKLRQGVGRLIRTENDTGVISILDSRATDGFYADKIAQVLKKYPRVSSIEEVETFIKNVKGKGYFDN